MKKSISLLFATLVICTVTNATQENNKPYNDQLEAVTDQIILNSAGTEVRFLKVKETENVSIQQLSGWLVSHLGLSTNNAFVTLKSFIDNIGMTHYRLSQTYDGIPIEMGQLVAHFKHGKLVSVNGDYERSILSLNSASISKSTAITLAIDEVGGQTYKWENSQEEAQLKKQSGDAGATYYPQADLVIVESGNTTRLAYMSDVYSVKPLMRYQVFVDASSGAIIKKNDKIQRANSNGSAETKYSGTQAIVTDSIAPDSFHLHETGTRSCQTMDMNQGFFTSNAVHFVDQDNTWNNVNAQIDEAATDAHWASEMFYDYFSSAHGRNSYDDAGANLLTYVHYSTNFTAAFWDGTAVSIGDGDGTATDPLSCIDIVGHEYTHGIVDNSAAFISSYESGSLSESFCDIFGTLVEFHGKPGSANYTMQEDANISGTPDRSLSNPNTYGQPDTYNGTNWAVGSADNGGIHTNGAVQNFWFYLLANGGSGTNDNGDAYSVSSIGQVNAAAITYRALTVYHTNSSQYTDARNYAIQAAEDLFGQCSAEAQAVTNAWHAVGVGNSFSNSAPVAAFTSDITYSCQLPTTVTFIDQSQNAVTYLWDFGDATTSNLANPTHEYTTAGSFDVTLIIYGSGCGGNDTLSMSNYIVMTGTGAPIAPSCTPNTTSYCCDMGIYNVTFDAINKTTLDGVEGYQDYTCTDATWVTAGNSYNISVTTGATYTEDVRVWIDYDNDGVFNNSNELVMQTNNLMTNHSGSVLISGSAVQNTPLRMRVMSDYESNTITDACYTPMYGQCEDYAVTIGANPNPPIVDFVADVTTVNIGGTVNFTDLTVNGPTAWNWTINGGTPASATIEDPAATFNTLGTYDIKLVASNANGTDSLTKTNYITVVNGANMCSNTSSSLTTGTIFDSGGPSGNFGDNEDCYFQIDPGCATSVTLEFVSMAMNSSSDRLYVYDGTTIADPLLGSLYGTTIPANLTATSGKMLLRFVSNTSFNYAGFEAFWTSVVPSAAPVADFTMTNATPAWSEQVDFTDISTNLPGAWAWDFGDGNLSAVQNPSHTYAAAGVYTVELIVDNCLDVDTITYTVTQQGPPAITFSPDTLFGSALCGDSTTAALSITNSGTGGDLSYTLVDLTPAPCMMMVVTINTVSWGNEVSYNITNSLSQLVISGGGYTNNSTYIDSVCVPAGNYIFNAIDSWGDGWNGGTYSVEVCGNVVANFGGLVPTGSGTSENFVVPNCGNGPSFISFPSTSGAVAMGNTEVVQVGLVPDGLLAGVYDTEIEIQSNDPAIPSIIVPVYITVTGQPLVDVSVACLDLGTAMVGGTNIDSATIYNLGCDTLHVTNISATVGDFTANYSSADIAPYDSVVVVVSFTPSAITSFTGDLNILNDDNDTLWCLTGIGVGAPVATVTPDSIYVVINGCDDSTSVQLTLDNTGQSDLIYTSSLDISSAGASLFYDGFESGISAWANGNTTPAVVSSPVQIGSKALQMDGTANTTTAFSQSFTPGQVDEISVWVRSTNVTQAGAYFIVGDANVASNNGILYQYIYNNNLYLASGAGTFQVAVVNDTWYFSEYKNIDYTNKTFDWFVDGNLISTGIAFQSNTTTEVSKVLLFNLWSAVTYYDDIKIGASTTNWLNYNNDQGTVGQGGSVVMDIEFNALGLNSGIYSTNLLINSNDPVNPQISVPLWMEVNGVPYIALSDTCLDLDTAMVGATNTDSVTIYNNGCDSLFGTNVSTSNGDFVVSTSSFSIGPNDSLTLYVDYTPSSIGAISNSIQIQNNDVDTTICLSGVGIGAPEVVLDPDSLYVTITGCDDSTTVPITIYNNGQSELSWDASLNIASGGASLFYDGFENGLSAYTTNGTVPTITNSVVQVGNYAMQMDGTGGFTTGMDQTFTAGQVDYVGVWVRSSDVTQAGAYFMVGEDITGAGNCAIFQYIYNGTLINYGSSSVSVNIANDTWYHSEYTNIDFTTHTFDWYVDGVLIGAGLSFRDASINSFYKVRMFNLWAATTYYDQLQIGAGGGAEWVSLDNETGNVSVSSNTDMNLTFYSDGMASGIYQTEMTFNSNDPVNPQILVPLVLEIIGTPTIALSDTCLDLGSTMVGDTSIDSLWVYNTGCDSLDITAVTSNLGVFTTNINTGNVAPGDSLLIEVSFSPTAMTGYNATLTIDNNDVTQTICLSGQGQGAPIVDVSPGSFTVSLGACPDSIVAPMYIGNTGLGDLDYQISGGDVEVLALTYGVDYANEYTNTIAAIDQYFTAYNLTEINTTVPATLQTALIGKHVLLIPEQETGSSSVFTGFASVLQDFANNGGTVIFCGTSNSSNAHMFNTGLFTGSYQGNISSGSFNLVLPSHPLGSGVNTIVPAASATHYVWITNVDKAMVVDYAGFYDIVTYRPFGDGKAIFIAYDYDQTNTDASRLIANAVEWGGAPTLADWISVDIESDSVGIGATDVVNVTFSSEGLSGGTYSSNIVVNSNDPTTPTVSIPVTLTVSNEPCAEFMAATSVCNTDVDFTDISINSPTSWAWDFGDGSGTSTLQHPSYTYGTAGTYQVTLLATNASGTNSYTESVVLVSSGGPIAASCYPTTTNYCCQMGILNVTLGTINNSTGDGADGYQDYTCATSSNLTSTLTYTVDVQSGDGSYNENVRVWIDWNNDGVFNNTDELVLVSDNVYQWHSSSFTVPASAVQNTALRMRVLSDYYNNTITDACTDPGYGQAEDYTVIVLPNNVPPVANMGAWNSNVCAGVFQFTDLSTNNPTSWEWDFGDGSAVSNVQNPTYTYTNPGTYTVQLTASNAFGTDVTTQDVDVVIIDASFTWSGAPNTGLPLDFTSTTSGAVQWDWDFDNTLSSSAENPTITYSVVGTYYVTLQVTSAGGCIDTYTDSIVISNPIPPVADFDFAIIDSCSGEIQFNDLSANYPTSWNWDFQDGWTSNLQNPVHEFGTPGSYDVELTATNSFGTDVISITVDVQMVDASFNYSGTLSVGEAVQFNSSSANAIDWDWDFGDGYSAGVEHPLHTYADTGDYMVTLVVTDINGCTDTYTLDIHISLVNIQESLNQGFNFVVYPNPAVNKFTINSKFGKFVDVRVDITNMLGQSIWKDNAFSVSDYTEAVDLTERGTGIYFVKMTIGDNQVIKRVVIH